MTSADIAAALKEALGQQPYEDSAREQISIPETSDPASAAALRQCRVRNAAGNEIPLGDLATIELVAAKLVVYRVNNKPAVLLVAQTLGEPNIQESREQIGALFAAARSTVTHGDKYNLTWLPD